MMTLFRSRVVGRSVLGALVCSMSIAGIAEAQSECPQDVVGVTNLGNRIDGELIGQREETKSTTLESGSTSGSLSGTASTGPVSGSGTIEGTSSTTTTVTTTSINVGTYQFEDGSRYEVDCSTLMTRQQLYPSTGE